MSFTNNKAQNGSATQGKKWLREASMRRLSLFVKNKTEMIGNAAQLGVGVLYPEKLEKSGLSPIETHHLEQWVSGTRTSAVFFEPMLCANRYHPLFYSTIRCTNR
jgi:hypothetical protein